MRYFLAAAALAATTPASAATLVTYSGTIIDGIDNRGVFGPDGATLAGQKITVSMIFDYRLGINRPSPNTPFPNRSVWYGYNGNGDWASPGLSAKISINGKTWDVIGDYRDLPGYPFASDSYPLGGTQIRQLYGRNEDISHDFYSIGCANFDCSEGWSDSYVEAYIQSADGSGLVGDFDPTSPRFFDASSFETGLGTFRGGNEQDDLIQGGFRVESLTISNLVSAVPEPSTWAMMLLGFSFVGGAMRKGKRNRKLSLSYS